MKRFFHHFFSSFDVFFAAWAVAALGLLLAGGGYWWADNESGKRIERDLEWGAREIYHQVVHEIKMGVDLMENIQGLYGASDRVEGLEFKTFTTPFLRRHRYIRAFLWAPAIKKSGNNRPTLQNTHFPIHYLERPENSNNAQSTDLAADLNIDLGADLAADPFISEALTQSLATGRSRIFLSHLSDHPQASERGVYLYLLVPVHTKKSLSEGSLGGNKGVVLGIFHFESLLQSAVTHLEERGILFRIGDVPVFSQDASWYTSKGADSGLHQKSRGLESPPPSPHFSRIFQVGGRPWSFEAIPDIDFDPPGHELYGPWFILIFGLLFTALLSLFLIRMQQNLMERRENEEALRLHRDHLDRTVQERTLALEKANRQNRSILAAAGEGICGVDQEGHITFINPAGAEMTGWEAGEMIGRHEHTLLNPTHADNEPHTFEGSPIHTTLRDGVSHQVNDEFFQRRDGSTFPVEYTSTPVLEDNRISGAVLMFRDTSRRIQLEEKERRGHQARETINALLQTALESRRFKEQMVQALDLILSGSAVVTQGKGAIFLLDEINNELELVAQRGLDAPLLTKCNRIAMGYCHCGKAAQTRQVIFSSHLDERHQIRFQGMAPHGHYCVPLVYHGRLLGVLNLYLAPGCQQEPEEEESLLIIANTLAGLIEQSRTLDLLQARQKEIESLNANLELRIREAVEKNRQMDVMLVQQSRLAAMGEMIGNIAHQWRQPINSLNLILANIQSAYEYGELTEEVLDEKVETGQKIILKMSSTIDDFRRFFKPDKRRNSFEPESVVTDALSLVGASLKSHHIATHFIPAPHPIQVFGFPNEYSQVILLVLTNAKDAIVQNSATNGEITIRLLQEEGNAVVLIRDNGGGVPGEIMAKIFDPYFTTKDSQHGTGIGLYMAKVIIEEHMSGRITACNVEEGAEFRIAIPVGVPDPQE
ncbi:MAG: PAS domain S-box protein [Magnetococcales bacterium]|nr:PAS domain S-box protein [Magnetococcales bacterium]